MVLSHADQVLQRNKFSMNNFNQFEFVLLLNLSLFLGHSKNPRSLFITDDAIFKITLLSISYIDHCSILRNEYYIIDVKFYMYARERKYNA